MIKTVQIQEQDLITLSGLMLLHPMQDWHHEHGFLLRVSNRYLPHNANLAQKMSGVLINGGTQISR